MGPQTKAQQKGIIKNTELIGEALGSSLTEDEVQELKGICLVTTYFIDQINELF